MMEWLGNFSGFWKDHFAPDEEVNRLQQRVVWLEQELTAREAKLRGLQAQYESLDKHSDALLHNYFGEIKVNDLDAVQVQFGLYFINCGFVSQFKPNDVLYFKKVFQQALWSAYQLGQRDKAETAGKYPL